ncbi:MAG TPA: hypothetical protein VGK84_11840 [Candidatus Tumulicola sp.]
MIRKLGFGLVVLTAVTIVACGRQVTPNPVGLGPGGAPEGFMSVFFDVSAPFNFSNYQYWIIFDTTGDGQTPSTQPFNNNYAGYSAAIEVTGGGGATSARAIRFIRSSTNPKIPPVPFYLTGVTPQQLQYFFNSNGTGTEFNVIFQRSIFLAGQSSPPPLARNWTFNAFTTQGNSFNNMTFVDSMGAGGPNQPQYVSPTLPTYQCFDTNPLYALSSGLIIDPPAQIVSTEIANNPSPVPSAAVPCSGDTTADGVTRHAASRM